MTLDTALPGEIQERVEQAVRDAIAGGCQNRTSREIPDPETGESLEIDLAPGLESIAVASPTGERVLRVELRFSPLPDTRSPIVPDSFGPDIRDALEFSPEEMVPTYLGDLDQNHVALSESIVHTLSEYCDALEEDPSIPFAEDRADLICARYVDENQCLFVARITYPEYVEYVYSNGLREQARRLGLPN
jgi:hypothetical protein